MKNRELYDAAFLLPTEIKDWVLNESSKCDGIEEIRLRCGKRVSLCCAGMNISEKNAPVFTKEHTAMFLERATRSSYHSVSESLKKGYITAFNGIRIGVCGTAVTEDNSIRSMRELSSFNIRIPHEKYGLADGIIDGIYKGGMITNTLIVSSPGGGKTTLLREIIRKISEYGINCSIVDERGELAAMHNGFSGFEVGDNTDVLSQAPKKDAVMMLLRTMNPSLIAMDEISEEEDMETVKKIYGCGVSVIATMHGKNLADIKKRRAVSDLLCTGVFENIAEISMNGGKRVITMRKYTYD